MSYITIKQFEEMIYEKYSIRIVIRQHVGVMIPNVDTSRLGDSYTIRDMTVDKFIFNIYEILSEAFDETFISDTIVLVDGNGNIDFSGKELMSDIIKTYNAKKKNVRRENITSILSICENINKNALTDHILATYGRIDKIVKMYNVLSKDDQELVYDNIYSLYDVVKANKGCNPATIKPKFAKMGMDMNKKESK